jgi:hypothetical protein
LHGNHCDPAKAEHGGDERDDQQGNGETEHSEPLLATLLSVIFQIRFF